MATFKFDPTVRQPWNSVIYPGNYVGQLNAYREQGVVALPGAVFFKGVGAVLLSPDDQNLLAAGVLPAGTYNPKILSPDLRQDDKPRKDKPFVLPKGAVVYRTAVSAPGVREATVAGNTTLTVSGISAPAAVPATALSSGFFEPVGEFSLFTKLLDGTGLAAETTVQVGVSADVIAMQNPSAGACRKSPSAIIVEVCYFMPDAVTEIQDINMPYAVEAGEGY